MSIWFQPPPMPGKTQEETAAYNNQQTNAEMAKYINEFSQSPMGKMFDPQGFMNQYNPWASEETKYGMRPGQFNPEMYAKLGGGGTRYYDQAGAQMLSQMNGLGNVGADDAYMRSIMDQAGMGASRDAKLRGLSGPYSINANERARMTSGLNYAQQENARRQALRAQLAGQYGNLMGQQADMYERRRQYNTGLAGQRHQAQVDNYNQRVAGHNSMLKYVPFVGGSMFEEATSRRAAY